MNEDRLLRDLGHLARERGAAEAARLDERWDRLSRGELSPEEEAELRALAEASPQAREAYEAFRPLGTEFQAGVVQALQQQAREAKLDEPPAPARLLPFRRLTSRIAGWGALAAAAAAAVLVFLLRSPVPLPEYASLSVTGGVSAYRGEVAETDTFAPGDAFMVVLQPLTAPSREQRLEAGCFLTREGEVCRLEVRSNIEPSGSIQMQGVIGGGVRPGLWTLWAVAGRPGDLPDPADLASRATGGPVRHRDWVAVSRPIRIQPRGP
jgi:hypothetical protein